MNRSLAPLYSRLLESLSSSCSFRNDDLVFSFGYFTLGRKQKLLTVYFEKNNNTIIVEIELPLVLADKFKILIK